MNVIKFVQIPFCIRSQWQNEVGDIHAAFDMTLSNCMESVVLKGPSVLETAQWSMAGPFLTPHTPIYLSLTFQSFICHSASRG